MFIERSTILIFIIYKFIFYYKLCCAVTWLLCFIQKYFLKYSPSPAILFDLISSLWSYAILNWSGEKSIWWLSIVLPNIFLVSAAFGFSFYPIPKKSFSNRVLNPLILPIIIYVCACEREREVYKHPLILIYDEHVLT